MKIQACRMLLWYSQFCTFEGPVILLILNEFPLTGSALWSNQEWDQFFFPSSTQLLKDSSRVPSLSQLFPILNLLQLSFKWHGLHGGTSSRALPRVHEHFRMLHSEPGMTHTQLMTGVVWRALVQWGLLHPWIYYVVLSLTQSMTTLVIFGNWHTIVLTVK